MCGDIGYLKASRSAWPGIRRRRLAVYRNELLIIKAEALLFVGKVRQEGMRSVPAAPEHGTDTGLQEVRLDDGADPRQPG